MTVLEKGEVIYSRRYRPVCINYGLNLLILNYLSAIVSEIYKD